MNFVEIFVVFTIIIIVIMFVQNHYGEVEYVKSKIDDRRYLVRKLPHNYLAADYLARVNEQLVKLAKHMVAKFPTNPDAVRLYNNYNPEALSESDRNSGFTSYTINKSKLVLCIRQDDETFVEFQTILYVAIHELGHMMTSSLGHTDEFWANFKMLLNEAIDIGVYNKQDFNNKPKDYCGIKITSSII
jgi:hypothetical protein